MPFKQDHEGISVLLEIGVAFFPICCWLKTKMTSNELDDKMTSPSLSNIHKMVLSQNRMPHTMIFRHNLPPLTPTKLANKNHGIKL